MGGCNCDSTDDGKCATCYVIESLEIACKGYNQLQAKINKLIETLKSKYEDKVEAEILEGMITDIKLAIIGEEESESDGDGDW